MPNIKAPLTLATDKKPHVVKLKVYWVTTRKWTAADIQDFQANVPTIAEKLRAEQYWAKTGALKRATFTCEDFAIRVLVEYAASHGLPIKLQTGAGLYRNMELWSEKHVQFSSTKLGFADRVMTTFGAPDMQLVGINTLPVTSPEALLPGDILAQQGDSSNNRAHHIQMVVSHAPAQITIYQGNSGFGNKASALFRFLRKNPADPSDSSYAGKHVEIGRFTKRQNSWDYENLTTGTKKKDFLKIFGRYQWNFEEFNK